MTCERCGGLMVPYRFPDISEGREKLYCEAWRCVNCGDVVDLVMLRNRTRPKEPVTQSKRRWSRKVAA